MTGKLRGTIEAKGTFLSEQLAIGAFLGHIDDLRIYRRALSHSEIGQLYTELD